ncbi:MAG: uroporphyrinogen decarboxylase family protein [Christensenella sp.]
MNRIERVTTVLNGGRPDVVPAGFWYHYQESFDTSRMAQEHIKTFREIDVDVYKVMQDYIQVIDTKVKTPSDWNEVRFPGCSSTVYQKLLDVVKRILDTTGHDALLFQTMFSPLKTAVQNYGYDLIMAHSRECPDVMAAAVLRIAEAQMEWAAGFIESGADGIFYAGQFSEPGRFTKDEFDKLAAAGDHIVLNAVQQSGGRRILHICGEPDYDYRSTPEWYTNYSFDIVNWSVKDTGLSLSDGRKLFGGRPVLGGMNNRGNILSGDEDAIREEVNSMISSADTLDGYMLGADCTIQGENISNKKIRVAVDAAHAYRTENH